MGVSTLKPLAANNVASQVNLEATAANLIQRLQKIADGRILYVGDSAENGLL
jgi:hypothetical protein